MSSGLQKEKHVSAETMIPDLLSTYPQARPVFDRYGLKGCGGPLGPHESIAFFARAHEVDVDGLLAEIEGAIGLQPCCPSPAEVDPDDQGKGDLADTIYRRYFLAGIAIILTLGATWGAALLWRIGLGHSFTGVRIHEINAHAQAQVFGWMGCFIMGFAYQAFPRFWHTTLVKPALAATTFLTLIAGVLAASVGQALVGYSAVAPNLATSGACLELLAVLFFAVQITVTFKASGKTLEPYVAYIFVALAWFVIGSFVNVMHTWKTATALTPSELSSYVTTYQPVLRDLQFHGLGMTLILGVSLRTLPHLFGLPRVRNRDAILGLFLLTTGVALEVASGLALRPAHPDLLALVLTVPCFLLLSATLILIWSWKLWKPFPEPDRSAKFIRAAYAWLLISLLMLLLSPAHMTISHVSFSHAYFGAIRHAITVGFISLMIMGYAAKVVPTLNGVDAHKLTPLWGPFALVNGGCALRVTLQTLTDWNTALFPYVGVSGILEVAGLAWWGLHLVRIILTGAAETSETAGSGPRPALITADQHVSDVLAWFPSAEGVFLRYGFTAIRSPLMRRTVGRHTSLAQACAMYGVALDEFIRALNDSVAD